MTGFAHPRSFPIYLLLLLSLSYIQIALADSQNYDVYSEEYFLFTSHAQNITCKSILPVSSGAQEFFNGCLKDTTQINFFGACGAQILEWFNQDLFLQYTTAFLFFLPHVAFNEKRELETQARANRLRCFLVLLIFRMALAASAASWFQALFQQDRPCECSTDPNGPFQQIGSIWGMPSADMMVTAIVGFFFIQYLSKLLGFSLILLVGFARVILGFDSVGQVFAGFIIALVLHVYHVGSPLFMRPIDYLVNFIGGTCTFILVKRDYPNVDFSFAVMHLNGVAWMTFAMAVFVLYYDWSLLKLIWKIPSHFMTDDTFLYYTPMREGSLGSTSFAPQRKHERLLFILLSIMLFFMLVGFRVFTPYINNVLEAVWSN